MKKIVYNLRHEAKLIYQISNIRYHEQGGIKNGLLRENEGERH